MPPSTSGIAAYSAELLPLLADDGLTIDVYTEESAQDFVWRHRRAPYDLTVYQLGNATCHDYMWGYLFRYPGLVVLHDVQLHQARALHLTRRWQPRRDDYLAEFRANHPEAPEHLGELVAAGLGGTIFQHWPLVRLVIQSARLTVVHNHRVAADLREQYPSARIEAIEMGVADPLEARPSPLTPAEVRRRHGIAPDAVVLGAFGGITPAKRIPSILRALAAVAPRHPRLQLLLVGATSDDYDVLADARDWGVEDRVHVTGFVPDAELPGYLQAADICACLRWPTNRETSASWLRCLAAGRTTLVSDLTHLADVPTVDPRGWRVYEGFAHEPVAVSIDVLDEPHALQLALERLAVDSGLGERMGRAARAWWQRHHQLPPMAEAYRRVVRRALDEPARAVPLPAHLTDDGSRRARTIVESIGVYDRVADVLPRGA